MKKLILIAAAAGAVAGAQAADGLQFRAQQGFDDTPKEAKADTTGFKFTDVKVLPHTSVKDQNKSGTCWCFSTTSFLEDEILRQGGDSLDISEMFTVRQCYLEKADRFVRMYGQANFAAGGATLDVLHVWDELGAVPEEVYTGLNYGEKKHSHGELDAALKAYLDVINSKPDKKISTAWRKGLEGILDAYLGEVPQTFQYKGKTYTPKSWAASLPIKTADYIPFTSFTHHPFYESFAIEVPDNWLWEKSMNVPMEEMKAIVDNALENGYPVAWGADVSEPGFKWKEGFAVMPKERTAADMEGTELSRWVHLTDKERKELQNDIKGPVDEIEVTQEMRQQMFDNQETTDDHGMEIIGYATDQNGKRYYKVRNSWDTNQIYDGYFYVSEPFFLAKTMQILVHKDAVPKDIAKKAKL
ncbi:MAG: C1 family peptidase [Muribaculaceae bacterium]|nr:C1 family peptidase [Muribaculaceae bacterium]